MFCKKQKKKTSITAFKEAKKQVYTKKSKEMNNSSQRDFWKSLKQNFYNLQPNVIGDLKSQNCIIHTDKQRAQPFCKIIFVENHINLLGYHSYWETGFKEKIQHTEDTSNNFSQLSNDLKFENFFRSHQVNQSVGQQT